MTSPDELADLTLAELNAHMAAVDAAAEHARESDVIDWDVLGDGEAAVAEAAARVAERRGRTRLWNG